MERVPVFLQAAITSVLHLHSERGGILWMPPHPFLPPRPPGFEPNPMISQRVAARLKPLSRPYSIPNLKLQNNIFDHFLKPIKFWNYRDQHFNISSYMSYIIFILYRPYAPPKIYSPQYSIYTMAIDLGHARLPYILMIRGAGSGGSVLFNEI